MKCHAQDCDSTRGYTLAHPLGGEVELCPEHYAKVVEAKNAVILQLLRSV